jgi:hypothetical protein
LIIVISKELTIFAPLTFDKKTKLRNELPPFLQLATGETTLCQQA